jgi:hypothetical protein
MSSHMTSSSLPLTCIHVVQRGLIAPAMRSVLWSGLQEKGGREGGREGSERSHSTCPMGALQGQEASARERRAGQWP